MASERFENVGLKPPSTAGKRGRSPHGRKRFLYSSRERVARPERIAGAVRANDVTQSNNQKASIFSNIYNIGKRYDKIGLRYTSWLFILKRRSLQITRHAAASLVA